MAENGEILKLIREMQADTKELNSRLIEHMSFEERAGRQVQEQLAQLNAEVSSLTTMFKAFPDNEEGKPDFAGHRTDHEQRRKADREALELKGHIKKKVAENLTTAILFALAVIVGLGLKDWLVSFITIK